MFDGRELTPDETREMETRIYETYAMSKFSPADIMNLLVTGLVLWCITVQCIPSNRPRQLAVGGVAVRLLLPAYVTDVLSTKIKVARHPLQSLQQTAQLSDGLIQCTYCFVRGL